jgi:hypothetical protein
MPDTTTILGVETFDEAPQEITEHPRDTSGCTFHSLV